MDGGKGVFESLMPAVADFMASLNEARDKLPAPIEELWPRLFMVGAEVEIRQSRFRIEYIGTDVLVLKLLPQRASDPAGKE